MGFIKAAVATVFIGVPTIFSAWAVIQCHEGQFAPGATESTTGGEPPPDVWYWIGRQPSGYVSAWLITEDDTPYSVGRANSATRQLILSAGKPKADCCHGVALAGSSVIDIRLEIAYPKVNHTSYAEIGDQNARAYTRWLGTADMCGTGWSQQYELDVWVRFQYTSVGGAPPARSVNGEWRYLTNGSPGGPTPIGDNGAPDGAVTATRNIAYYQTQQFVSASALAVDNSCQIGTVDLVRTHAPPNGTEDTGQAYSRIDIRVTGHRIMCLGAGCSAVSQLE